MIASAELWIIIKEKKDGSSLFWQIIQIIHAFHFINDNGHPTIVINNMK